MRLCNKFRFSHCTRVLSVVLLGLLVSDTASAIQPPSKNESVKLANSQIDRRSAAVDEASRRIRAAADAASSAQWVSLGDAQLRAGQVAKSIKSFEKAIEQSPQSLPYLWQYGIALYFDGRFDDGRRLFEKHRIVNPNDVENAAWHFLCVAKSKNVASARKIVLPAPNDPRPPMAEILKRLSGGDDHEIVRRMGELNATSADSSAGLYGNLYLGLIADAEGNKKKAVQRMRTAADTPYTHYMADVARVYAERLRSENTTTP